MNCRAAAAQVIAGILRNQGSLASLIPLHQNTLKAGDKGLFQDLCYGTSRWYPKIAVILQQLLSKPLRDKDSDIQALLAIGIYQLSETRIPDHAALNETVSASKDLRKNWSKALINGVLRNFLRQRDNLSEQLRGHPQFDTAHPDWLLSAWSSAFPEEFSQLVAANNQRPPMTLRVNCRQTGREDFLTQLRDKGLEGQATAFSPVGVTLTEPTNVDAIPGFAEGVVSVQDEAAQLAAVLLEPKPGDTILDACCAPGGKTCHIQELAENQAEIVALDIDADRLTRVQENLDRLNLTAQLIAIDAVEVTSWWDGKLFDRILLDAPCSATGVIRRHPDIKLLRRPEDIDKLTALQLAMLKALWQTLKPGGHLLYATCSTLPQENKQVIERFISSTPDVSVVSIDAEWGIADALGRQMLPQADGHDGFYYAKLQKTANTNSNNRH